MAARLQARGAIFGGFQGLPGRKLKKSLASKFMIYGLVGLLLSRGASRFVICSFILHTSLMLVASTAEVMP